MKQIQIEVTDRAELGSSAMKRLRREGLIPGVVYGDSRTPSAFSVNNHTFKRTVLGQRQSQLYKLQSKNTDLNGLVVLIKELQFEPLHDQVLHVDFYAITEGHKITVSIALELVGECPAVKLGEAILNQTAYEIEVECLPSEIPDVIKVDISELVAGHAIHAGDLKLPANVVLMVDEDTSIVGALIKREEEEAPVVAAPVEGTAGAAPADGAAAAAPADGAKPAAGGAKPAAPGAKPAAAGSKPAAPAGKNK